MNNLKVNLTREEKTKFYKTLFTLALPMILQNALGTALNFIDTFMISSLSTDVIAGVTAANKIFFIIMVFCFGIFSGGSVLIAQYHGSGDIKNIKRVLGASILISSVVAGFLSALSFLQPAFVLGVVTNDLNAINAGVPYLRFVSLTYVPMAISSCYSSALKSTRKVRVSVVIASISILLNTVLNYTFIFGNFGARKMGAGGAGLATLSARLLELSLFLIIVYVFDKDLGGSIKELFDFNRAFISKFFNTVIPVVLGETVWVLGVTVHSIVFGHMGANVLAATGIIDPIFGLVMFSIWGLNGAASVIMGNKLGSGEGEKVFSYAKVLIRLIWVISISIVIIMLVFNENILSLFPIDDDLRDTVISLMVVAILATPIKNNNFILITSILRSGGDTKYCLYLEFVSLWIVSVPIALVTGLVIGLEPVYVYFLTLFSDELVKLVFGIKRMYGKKWIRNLTVE